MTQTTTFHADRSIPPLPPPGLRLCGAEYKDDTYFLASAVREVERLIERRLLSVASRVLEIGCGPGRFAIGLLHRLGTVASYTGVDIRASAIRWCEEHLTPLSHPSRLGYPTFNFVHLDAYHSRYNAGGQQLRPRLPASDSATDLIYLYSVFSHMPERDIDHHLTEFRRVLSPTGHVDLTGFFEPDVEPVSVNPAGYLRSSWNGALHCVRYSREFFENKVTRHGLEVAGFEHQVTPSGQSRYLLRRQTTNTATNSAGRG